MAGRPVAQEGACLRPEAEAEATREGDISASLPRLLSCVAHQEARWNLSREAALAAVQSGAQQSGESIQHLPGAGTAAAGG